MCSNDLQQPSLLSLSFLFFSFIHLIMVMLLKNLIVVIKVIQIGL